LRSGQQVAAVLFEKTAGPGVDGLLGLLAGARMIELSRPLFQSLSTTEASQGVLTLVPAPTWTFDSVMEGDGPVVVLDGIQDPGNAGAIVRSAEAFGAAGAVFLKGTVSPFNPKSLRASAGSLFRARFAYGVGDEQLLNALDQRGMTLFAAVPEGAVPLDRVDLGRKCAVVFGNEGHGIRPELSCHASAVYIPTQRVESLNAAVAAGVILYEGWRQRESR
jgi:TrmH family RNA methyltransferase